MVYEIYKLPVLCNDVICCGFCVNISFCQANFEGYTTEVIFQVFQKTFDDHFLPCFYTKRGFGECILVTCSTFYVLVYRAYGVFDAELCTTIWAPVLTNRQFKATSQENINSAMHARFLPDAYFTRSVARRPIFLTLNNVVKSPSGRLTATAGRLFGHRPIISANDKIFGRCPADVPATIAQGPGGGRRGPVDCRRTTMNPAVIGRSPFDDRATIAGSFTGGHWVQI